MMKRIFPIVVFLVYSLALCAYAPNGTFLAEVQTGDVKRTIWLKMYDDPKSPYIGQFNSTPYKSFTIQYRVDVKNVKGSGECRADVSMYYKATGYVSRSANAQSFYLRTMKLDRKIEKIVLHEGFIEDQEKMRDALLESMDISFYTQYQNAVVGEQRYDYINWGQNGFSVGMNPYTKQQLNFITSKSAGIANNLEATLSNIKISAKEHDPLTIPDDSLYNPGKNNVEPWSGRWEGGNKETHYIIELYSDFTMGIHQTANIVSDKYDINVSFSSEGTWEVQNGNLVLKYDKSKNMSSIGAIKCPECSDIEKSTFVALATEQMENITQVNLAILGHNQNYMKLKGNSTSFYLSRKRANTYTPHLYPEVLPQGDEFKEDVSNYRDFHEAPKGLVRGTLIKKNGDHIIGLFRKNLELHPVLTTTYNSNKELIATSDSSENIIDSNTKEKEVLNNMILADRYLTPDSGCSKYTYATGITYDGCWLNHYPDGEGTKTWPNGAWLSGKWQQGGFMGGTGKQVFGDGEIYEGEINAQELPHGTGKLEFDKGVYLGKFASGNFVDNEGKMTYKNGAVYEGEWDGIGMRLKQGHGTLTLLDNTRIEGDWSMDKLMQAKIAFSNGDNYDGTIQQNQFAKGNLITNQYNFEGEFADSYFASGTITLQNGNHYKAVWKGGNIVQCSDMRINITSDVIDSFEGSFESNNSLYAGSMHFAKGYTITSSWENEKMANQAVIVFDNGDKVIANWTDGFLTPETEFLYQWADGMVCKATVTKKSKLAKLTYSKEGEDKITNKDKKAHEMMYTADEDFLLPAINYAIIYNTINTRYDIPHISE